MNTLIGRLLSWVLYLVTAFFVLFTLLEVLIFSDHWFVSRDDLGSSAGSDVLGLVVLAALVLLTSLLVLSCVLVFRKQRRSPC